MYTKKDLKTFTHILYLDVSAETVAQRRVNDTERERPPTSVAHLQKWQQAEEAQLRELCRQHNILFALVPTKTYSLNKYVTLLRDFRQHTVEHNLAQVFKTLDGAFASKPGQFETVLVLDADKTIAAADAGSLF